ncbi:MAG: MnmC family methyltransferase [Cyanobacteria bacterium]|nr:MnmC family methyltransferase [Cyanobacteriota bacterium]
MTWPACGAEAPAEGHAEGHASAAQAGSTATSDAVALAPGDLEIRHGGDGSFSLWSTSFGEGFHSGRGALREAQETFVQPSQLERFCQGQRLKVVEVCVGTGTNLAALLEASAAAGLELEWWGLELDPAPLQLALAKPEFRSQWQPQTLNTLESLSERGCWQQGCWQQGAGSGRMLWGDARQMLPHLLEQRRGQVDLIWDDAFSPQRCPQLWTVEFLGSLAELLADGGRWISYCSAAAVREGLRLANLNVVALATADGARLGKPDSALAAEAEGVEGAEEGMERAEDCLKPDQSANQRRAWSGGTLASRAALEPSTVWRQLTAMEFEHLASSAGEPYRDPSRIADAAAIRADRREAQAASLARGERTSSSAWRKRWGMETRRMK